jgi:hypothetical protein
MAIANKAFDDRLLQRWSRARPPDLNPPVLSTPGHGLGRLATFLEGGVIWIGTDIVGDDEQYAATMALMADSIGVPGRVVLGAQVPAGGVVTGADVHAWVEVEPVRSRLGAHQLQGLPADPPGATRRPLAPAPRRIERHSACAATSGQRLRSPLDVIGGSTTSATSHFAHPKPPPGFRIPVLGHCDISKTSCCRSQ